MNTIMMMHSIHSPADSLVLSSSFDSMDSLSPPPTPGRKRSYYPDKLSPMPEFFSSNGSLLSADHLLVEVEVMSKEEEARLEGRLLDVMACRPLPSFVLHPKSSYSARTNMKLQLEHIDQIPPLPYSEPSPAPPTHHRMAFASLPRLPSLSEHNMSSNERSPSAEEFMLKPEHHLVVDDNNDDVMSGRESNTNSKLPSFQRKGMERTDGKEGRRNSLVARCA
ncbi:hypothetical protein ACHAXM_000378 [Skeletonema potamos]|jgi:hypothetical protein